MKIKDLIRGYKAKTVLFCNAKCKTKEDVSALNEVIPRKIEYDAVDKLLYIWI